MNIPYFFCVLLAMTCLGYTCAVQFKNQPQKFCCSLNHPLLCSFVGSPYLRLIRLLGPRVALIWHTTSTLVQSMLCKDTLTDRKLVVLKRKASKTVNNLAVYRKSSSIPSSSFPPQCCSFKMAAVCFFFFFFFNGGVGREACLLAKCIVLWPPVFSPLCSPIPKVVILFSPSLFFTTLVTLVVVFM